MKNPGFYIIIVLFTLWPGRAFSQSNCITDPPLSPLLTSVSVQPETGNTLFTWTPSPSPDIAAYILYSYKNGDGMALDTIRDPSATSYSLTSTATKYFSVSYVVAAMRLPRCTSIFSNVLTSIFEKVSVDTCHKKIEVSWNTYTSSPVKVNGYTVLLSVNGANFSEAGNVSSGDTTFTINDFTIDAVYCFVVHANLEGGKTSSSNMACVSTKMQRPPLWINADQATLNSADKIELSFSIDPLSEIKNFSLERKTGNSGSFQEISQPVSSNGSLHFTDNQAKTNNINYYRLSAVNSCNLPVVTSNLASNIVLSSVRSGDSLILSWNAYKMWLGIVSSYKLFINTGRGFEEKADIPASDTTYILDYKRIMYDVSGKEVCFYVSASEISNPYGVTGESTSSGICISPSEIITVPDLFTPDNDLKNDLFRPILSFTPLNYHLLISDRRGTVIFETRDFQEEWNGTQNGIMEPGGVYLWYLKLTTPSGKTISRTGTITIFRNK